MKKVHLFGILIILILVISIYLATLRYKEGVTNQEFDTNDTATSYKTPQQTTYPYYGTAATTAPYYATSAATTAPYYSTSAATTAPYYTKPGSNTTTKPGSNTTTTPGSNTTTPTQPTSSPTPFTNRILQIDASMNTIRQLIMAIPPPDNATLANLNKQLEELKQEKINIISSNTTSNSFYNSDNFDITYHTDPTEEKQPDSSTAGVGQMWVKVDGKLVAVPYDEVKNTTLYYQPGTYTYNSASYVPNYEESVFLSKLTNEPTTSEVVNQPINKVGFCEATQNSMIERDQKCNALDKNICSSTDCCVLFGGEKCVAGSASGPTNKSNYSDITVINRDYYYYRGKCYGNCS